MRQGFIEDSSHYCSKVGMRESVTQSNTCASSICEKKPPKGISWARIHCMVHSYQALGHVLAVMRVRVRCEKGKPIVRR